MRFLAFERRWLIAVFETILPSDAHEELREGAADVPLESFLVDLERSAPLRALMGLRACLWVVMVAPLFVLGRLATFVTLDPAARLDLLLRLQDSDVHLLRETPLLFKTFACLAYCGLPRVQRTLGLTVVDDAPPEWALGEDGDE